MITTQLTPTAPRRPRTRTRDRVVAVAGAAIAALAVWAIAGPLAGVDLRVASGAGGQATQVGPGSVLATSLIASLAAWGLLAVLERTVARARTVWTVIALVVLALSMGGPLTAGLSAGTKLALAAMHVAVAAVLIPVLRRTSPTA